jgi:hypothetical protein
LQGKDGFLEYVDDSSVVNDGGARSTFGFFIRLYDEGVPGVRPDGFREFFVLFSYDMIKLRGIPAVRPQQTIVATELFLFGTVHNGDAGQLMLGLAVGADGTLLPEVPIELAKVSKYKGEKDHKGETVKPGVSESGKGCMVCHSREDGMPQNTGPFPWAPFPKEPKKQQAATPPVESQEPSKTDTKKTTTTEKEGSSTTPQARSKSGQKSVPQKKNATGTHSTATSRKDAATTDAVVNTGISIGVGIARERGRREEERHERSKPDMGRSGGSSFGGGGSSFGTGPRF